MSIENHCMSLQLEGLEIPKGFIPLLLTGTRCTLQLPQNCYDDFCGFLMCAVVKNNYGSYREITMEHDKSDITGMDSHCVLWRKRGDGVATWLGYVSFGSLRHTAWWDETCNTVSFSMNFSYANPDPTDDPDNRRGYMSDPCTGFGVRLVSRNSESGLKLTAKITTDCSEFFDESYDFKHKFKIRHDSKSALKIVF